MVQSIWLQFDKNQQNPETIETIISTVNKHYKTYSYKNTININKHNFKFKFLNCEQIRDICNKLNLEVDDTKRCGCNNTDFEILTYFSDLTFYYGNLYDVNYFCLGRDCYLTEDMYTERIYILRYILEYIQSKLPKSIKTSMDFSDVEKGTFDNYKMEHN